LNFNNYVDSFEYAVADKANFLLLFQFIKKTQKDFDRKSFWLGRYD